MNYAWVIDQTRCIGCHACSTACKSENDVPLGVHRTWVKNVEVGAFPNVRRHFAVLRCNHCADPPCVHICPVNAMFQRADGIVDIDHNRCIGCKACMQACPYDAIHMDPESDTVAKCHFCAHRVDRGLLPACVVVCPVEALVFGDLDDPASRVNRVIGAHPVTVRRPEQGTKPKAFYVGAHQATLDPLAATHDESYMWSDRMPGTAKDNAPGFNVWSLVEPSGPGGNGRGRKPATNRQQDSKTDRSSRPTRSRMPKARVAYDVHHQITWRGKVSAYLWTKSIAAGAAFVAALFMLLDFASPDALHATSAPILAMAALGMTGVLLVADLKKPSRFLYVLIKPQWRSWLTKGAYIISAYGAVLTAWMVIRFMGLPPSTTLLWATLALAAGTAVYTAFLFGQCEARDLWQSPLLGVSLLVQMIVAGTAALLLTSLGVPTSQGAVENLALVLAIALIVHVVTVALGEVMARHGSSNAAAAAHVLVAGRYAPLFWTSMIVGGAAPAAMLLATSSLGFMTPAAAGLALLGLLMYEHAFVMAGQAVPIS